MYTHLYVIIVSALVVLVLRSMGAGGGGVVGGNNSNNNRQQPSANILQPTVSSHPAINNNHPLPPEGGLSVCMAALTLPSACLHPSFDSVKEGLSVVVVVLGCGRKECGDIVVQTHGTGTTFFEVVTTCKTEDSSL